MKRGTLAASTFAVLAIGTIAWAGTKFQTNIVPLNATNPTLSEKSKLKMVDKGTISGKLDGVVDSGGSPVNGDGSFDGGKQMGTLTGDEYAVILNGEFVALSTTFDFVLMTDLKGGKGKVKKDAAVLFGLIPGGLHRATDLGSIEVWGPVGDQVCDLAAADTCLEGGSCSTNGDCSVSNNCGPGQCQGGNGCSTNADCPLVGDCQALLANGFNLPPAPNPCLGGEQIGIGGVLVP